MESPTEIDQTLQENIYYFIFSQWPFLTDIRYEEFLEEC